MKRTVLILMAITVLSATAVAQDADPITEATIHAREDGGKYKATCWGSLAFGPSVLLSPLFGGSRLIVATNLAEPNADIPTVRPVRDQDARAAAVNAGAADPSSPEPGAF